ncbi:MAG: glucose 1-dehydrogenase [Azospirillaceae bacterium]|nr:glucose 1-dehydrogenase [Azospirillaceae bacterium]
MRDIDLSGRVALVTGAARGIGEATARRLIEAGCTVVLNARTLNDEAQAVFADLDALRPGSTTIIDGSVAEPAVVATIARTIFAKYKRLDILVNNAGIQRDNYIGMIPDAEIEAVMVNNVFSVIRLTQALSRLMKRNGAGSIVNVASILARTGNPGQFVYSASKAAVIGATMASAKELGPSGIRVNAVAPGLIATRMTEAMTDADRRRWESQIPLGRVGSPAEVADVIAFLASDLSRYVTGQVIGIDGGLVI